MNLKQESRTRTKHKGNKRKLERSRRKNFELFETYHLVGTSRIGVKTSAQSTPCTSVSLLIRFVDDLMHLETSRTAVVSLAGTPAPNTLRTQRSSPWSQQRHPVSSKSSPSRCSSSVGARSTLLRTLLSASTTLAALSVTPQYKSESTSDRHLTTE